MAGKTQIPWPDDRSFLRQLDNLGPTKLASKLNVSRSAVQHRGRKLRGGGDSHEPAPAGVVETEGIETFTTDPTNSPPAPWKPEEVMRAHGRNPDDYEIVRERYNRWGKPEEPLHQLRFDAIPKDARIVPADPTNWKPPRKPKVKRAKRDIPEKTLLCSDLHAPLQEHRLCEQLFHVLEAEKPDKVKMLGDILDAERASRWPARRKARSTQAGINGAHDFFQSGRRAHEDAEWEVIPGNHDWRIENYLMGRAPEIAVIGAAHDELPAHHLRRLLKLDELGVKYTEDEEGDWETTHIVLSPLLAATHKAGAGKNASRSALDLYDHSIVQGDTHRLEFKYKTKAEYNIDHEADISTRASIQVGCLCSREAAFYSKRPDFQQGFVMAYIYPDGRFSVEPYIHIKGDLLCPGGIRLS